MADNKLLTEEDYKVVLSKCVNSSHWKLLSSSVDPLGSFEGLSGEHFKVKIQFEDDKGTNTSQFFLKVLNSSMPVLFEMCISINAYGKEEFLYENLIKEFNATGIDTSYAPTCYLCRPYLILLEDLSLNGYRNTPKKDMLDIKHCNSALKTLANFHASAIVYEEIKSKKQSNSYRLLNSYPAYFDEKLFAEEENAASKWFNCTLQGLLAIINFLPENEIKNEEFKKKLLEELETFPEIVKPSNKFRNTIIHGDLWTNNFMFKYENEEPVNSMLIDYQLLKYGTPALDVVQMIVTNVRRSLRNEVYDEFLNTYYAHFSEYLAVYDICADDILPKADFLESCEEVKFVAKMQATADHSITFLTDEVVGKALESEDQLETFLFRDRTEGITASYKGNDLYRDVLQEDLIELRDLLFSG